jgi:hypothetical protein
MRAIALAVSLSVAITLTGCGGHHLYSAKGKLTWTGGLTPGTVPGRDIRVSVRRADGWALATVYSDAQGTFHFKLPRGRYTLAFEQGRGCPATLPLEVPGPTVAVDCPRM